MVHRCLLSTIFLLKFFGVSESAYQPICTNIARRRPDDFVIVAHSDHESWNCTLRAIDTLSSCGISNVIIDLRLVQDSNSLPFSCRSGKPLIALNCAAGLSAHTSCGPVRWLDISSTGSDVTSDTFHHTAIPDSANKNGVYRDERKLRVATLPAVTSPFSRIKPVNDTNTTEISFEGVAIEVLALIAQRYHFSYDIVTPSDQQYGINTGNGTYNGLVGMLQRGEADVVATDLAITRERMAIIDFSSSPFYYSLYGILINVPSTATRQINWWGWTDAFGLHLWLYFLSSLALVTAVLYGAHACCARRVWANRHFHDPANCVMYTASGYMNQGAINLTPSSWWAQILLTLWWLLCILEVACYGSFLIATLTAPTPTPLPFQEVHGLAALLERNEYKMCIRSGTSFHQQVLQSNSSLFKTFRKWIEKHPAYVTQKFDGCIEILKKDSKVAYLAEDFILEAYQKLNSKNHEFLLIRDNFYLLTYGFGFPKNSALTAIFSNGILDIIQHGLVGKWYKDYSATSPYSATKEDKASGAYAKRLSLHDFFSVFALFSFGMLISAAAFALEKAAHR